MATDRRNTHRWAGWATIILVVALIGYPLSVGPLGLLSKATGDSAEFNRIMDPYYVLLRKLPPWARGALARWSHFWRGDRPNQ